MNAQDIKAHANDISLNQSAANAETKLCEIWPTAKEALTALEGLIKNPIAKISIGAIIAAGDAVVAKICK